MKQSGTDVSVDAIFPRLLRISLSKTVRGRDAILCINSKWYAIVSVVDAVVATVPVTVIVAVIIIDTVTVKVTKTSNYLIIIPNTVHVQLQILSQLQIQ